MPALDDIIIQIKADTGNLRRELDQVIGKVNSLSEQGNKAAKGVDALSSSFGLLNKVAGAAGIGLSIGGTIKLTNDFIERSSKLEGVFGNLKLNIDKAKEATGGLVSGYDLAVAANKAMSLGLNLTSEQFATLARSAAIAGKTMGQDVGKSVDDLIIGLSRQSPKILDNLGIQIKLNDAHDAYARKLGVSSSALTEEQKTAAFTEAALDKLKQITDGATLSNTSLAGSLVMLKTKFTDATDAAIKWANSVGGDDGLTGQSAIDRLNKTLAQKADPTWNDDIINKTRLAREFAAASLSAAAAVEKMLGESGLAAANENAPSADKMVKGGLGGLEGTLDKTKRNLIGLDSTPLHKIKPQKDRGEKGVPTEASMQDDRFGKMSPEVALSALMNNEYYRFYALNDDAEFRAAVEGGLSLAAQRNAALNEATNKMLEGQFKGGRGPQNVWSPEEHGKNRQAAINSMAFDAASSGLEQTGWSTATIDKFAEALQGLGEQARTVADIIGSSIGAMQESIGGGLVDALSQAILAGKDFGKVMAQAVGQQLLALSKMYAIKAVSELAEGFATLFLYPAQAALHFKSAALYGSAAALAGAAGIGMSAAGGGGGSSGGGRTARPRGVDRGLGGRGGDSRGAGQPMQGATFNYVVNTVIPPNPTEASAAVASLLNGAKSAGFL